MGGGGGCDVTSSLTGHGTRALQMMAITMIIHECHNFSAMLFQFAAL